VVFVKDRFEVLAYRDVDAQRIKDESFRAKEWRRPIMAIANMPTDSAERDKVLEETLFEGKPDIQARPEYWSPYYANSAEVIAGSRPVAELLQQHPEFAADIDQDGVSPTASDNYVYAPVMGRKQVFSLILEKSTGKPVVIVPVDPWDMHKQKSQLARSG